MADLEINETRNSGTALPLHTEADPEPIVEETDEEPVFKSRNRSKNLRKRKRESDAAAAVDEIDSEVLYAEFFALVDYLSQSA